MVLYLHAARHLSVPKLVWKTPADAQFVVNTPSPNSSCHLAFSASSIYLILLSNSCVETMRAAVVWADKVHDKNNVKMVSGRQARLFNR